MSLMGKTCSNRNSTSCHIFRLNILALTHRSIVQCELNSGMVIPLFTKALRQNKIPRECSKCLRSLYDINFDSVEQWEESCRGLEGPWMDQVLLFPRKNMLKCYHNVTVCKDCYEKHLITQREEESGTGDIRLSCPECDRILEHQELEDLQNCFAGDGKET
jgi:hypothetical protein